MKGAHDGAVHGRPAAQAARCSRACEASLMRRRSRALLGTFAAACIGTRSAPAPRPRGVPVLRLVRVLVRVLLVRALSQRCSSQQPLGRRSTSPCTCRPCVPWPRRQRRVKVKGASIASAQRALPSWPRFKGGGREEAHKWGEARSETRRRGRVSRATLRHERRGERGVEMKGQGLGTSQPKHHMAGVRDVEITLAQPGLSSHWMRQRAGLSLYSSFSQVLTHTHRPTHPSPPRSASCPAAGV
jgi:hypothetical protein